MIHLDAEFLCSFDPVKLDKLYAFKIYSTWTGIAQGEIGKKNKPSPKGSRQYPDQKEATGNLKHKEGMQYEDGMERDSKTLTLQIGVWWLQGRRANCTGSWIGKRQILPSSLWKKHSPPYTLVFGPVILILDFWSLELLENNFCYFNPPSLWQFVKGSLQN